MAVESQFKGEMEAYWRINSDSVSAASVWDALKAYTCVYQTVIARVHRERRVELTRLEPDMKSYMLELKLPSNMPVYNPCPPVKNVFEEEVTPSVPMYL